jgi:hypothetical protein
MPLAIFNIGGELLLLGFTFKVLQVTGRFTGFKNKEAGRKLLTIGIVCIAAGVLIVPIVWGMPNNERNTMISVGLNIGGIGVFTLIQYWLKPQNEYILGRIAVGVITLGFLLIIIYRFVYD